MADPMMQWCRYNSQNAQMSGVAEQVTGELRTALQQKTRASLVVPGGRTPAPFFHIDSKQQLHWSRIDILPSDERFVPLASPRSNTRLIHEHLQQDNARHSTLIAFWQPDITPEQMAKKLAETLPTPPDVCVLGMGADMHTASLFPGTANLAEALDDPDDRKVFVVNPKDQETRLTLSGAVLASAQHLHLLITGADKKTALEHATRIEDTQKAPIKALIIKHKKTKVHFSD